MVLNKQVCVRNVYYLKMIWKLSLLEENNCPFFGFGRYFFFKDTFWSWSREPGFRFRLCTERFREMWFLLQSSYVFSGMQALTDQVWGHQAGEQGQEQIQEHSPLRRDQSHSQVSFFMSFFCRWDVLYVSWWHKCNLKG